MNKFQKSQSQAIKRLMKYMYVNKGKKVTYRRLKKYMIWSTKYRQEINRFFGVDDTDE